MSNGFVEIDTSHGRLRGVRFRGIDSYLGIPYGASTAGEGRFAPPRPAEDWTGVREAMWFGDAAPQVDTRVGSSGGAQEVHNLMYVKGGHPLDGARMSEDCLNLNVWTPNSRDDAERPVMVWFHGGGFAHGSAGSALYNGDQLAALGDVVVVTVNARLGIHGFLPLELVAGEAFAGAANAGMLDLVAALEWVHNNIGAFGGDANNVTIFGQSGGGGKVNTLMAMPAAKGLFHKAINMSGPVLSALEPAEARDVATRVMEKAAVTSAKSLRDLSMRELLDIQRDLAVSLGAPFGMGHGGASTGEISMGFAPVLDGRHVTGHPFRDGAPAAVESVPMLVGWATHDPSLLMCASPDFAGLTDKEASQRANENYGERGVALFEKYTRDVPEEAARLRYARVVNDFTFRAAGLAIAEAKAEQSVPVYAYEFSHPTSILDGLLGATHSLDLPFVFANVDRSVYAGQLATRGDTSTTMALAWIAFARTGNPNHEAIPGWAPFESTKRMAMQIGPEWTPVPQPSAAELTTGKSLVS